MAMGMTRGLGVAHERILGEGFREIWAIFFREGTFSAKGVVTFPFRSN
jgi:hypothetical protein